MQVVKRISSIFLIVLLLVAVPFLGQLPCNTVYAEQQPAPGDEWTNVPTNEQYLAFKAYMRARDLTLSGSAAGALTTFTSDMYQNLVKTVGLDMNSIQAGIFGVYQNNQWLRFGFSYLGINAFNMLCAQFLQDYSINVGDENVNKTLKTGKWFTDNEGRGAWVYEVNSSSVSYVGYSTYADVFSAVGSVYRFSWDDLKNLWEANPTGFTTTDYYINGLAYYFTFGDKSKTAYAYGYSRTQNFKPIFISWRYAKYENNAHLAILHYQNGAYVLGFVQNQMSNGQVVSDSVKANPLINLSSIDTDVDDTTIDVTSPKVKGPIEPPSGDDIVEIEPDGTIPDPEPEPPEPGGTVPDWTLPDTQITPIDPDNPSGGSNIDWNFSLPDLNIDWSIEGLKDKFPFSIPFDIAELVSILDVEPQTPEFSGSIDFIVYQWDFDFSLEQFDNIAAIVRNLEFVGFLFGLIMITRSLIKG